MVYNVVIDKQVAKDRDKLVESLYTFLYRYIPTRLVYENEEDRADCAQDTIMFILKRYDDLVEELNKTDKDWQDKFNYEKYFYNRARSYISFWIRKLKKDRDNKKEYIENAIYLRRHIYEDNIKPIDYDVLNNIVKEYNFSELDSAYLKDITIQLLKRIGYDNTEDKKYYTLEEIDLNKVNVLQKIAYSVVDEYLVTTIGDK